jgi:hypothetical protein
MLTDMMMSSLSIVCPVGFFIRLLSAQPKITLLPNMKKNKDFVFIVERSGS